MKIINAADVRLLLEPSLALESQRAAFAGLADGAAWQPDKIGGGLPGDADTVFCYAARMNRETGAVSKFGAVHPGNHELGSPAVHSILTLLDPVTGAPVAVLDGSVITELRTSAASALAVEVLSPQSVSRLVILGSGVQGKAHVRALSASRTFTDIVLWSPDEYQTRSAVDELQDQGFPVTAVDDLHDALKSADVVVCATLATSPLFPAEVIKSGATVMSIGSFESHRLELDVELLERSAAVVVDHEAIARSHCGPVVAADLRHGGRRPLVELGSALVGDVIARTHDSDIVTYLSVGLGVQDAAAGWAVYDRAQKSHRGLDIEW